MAEIGIIGGTGFYEFFEDAEKIEIETPYGKPSSPVTIGEISGRKVAFIARHGPEHKIPPHKVPYLANIYALKQLGISRIIAPAAVGSLKKEIKPGDFVICDQFVNFTRRKDTFYDNKTVHISAAYPYCPELREIIIKKGKELGYPIHEKGTVVVIQGPRFSTRAESDFFRKQGWDIINMTQYPECILAREQEICYVNISLVTDYDAGLKDDPSIKPVTIDEVLKIFKENEEKLKNLIKNVIPLIPKERSCPCSHALKDAEL